MTRSTLSDPKGVGVYCSVVSMHARYLDTSLNRRFGGARTLTLELAVMTALAALAALPLLLVEVLALLVTLAMVRVNMAMRLND